MVDEALPAHPFPEADLVEQVDRGLLEDAGPDPMLDVRPVPILEDDRFDPVARQQV